ncbi:MAG TPA: hypothetical protein VFE90_21840 [Myxococcales bacterium]|nr:hypothetical protein [Myxococcales bacterium]
MRVLALLLLLAACTPDFAAPSDVTDLRVLAVQAEPPEARFDPDAGVAEPVKVDVLAVDPSRDAGPQSIQLQICGPTDSRRCDEGPVIDAGTVPLSFTLPSVDATALLANDDLAGFGGIRVQLSFTVDDGSPKGPVHGDKVIIYSSALPPCPPDAGIAPSRNRNPALTGVLLTVAGQDAGAFAPDASLTVGTEYGLRPVLADGGEEDYCTVDLRGEVLQLREQAHYAFFTAPGGEFDSDTADEPLDGGAPPDGLTRFTPHADAGTIWIVVRDGRGGESWLERSWTASPDAGVSPTRPSSGRGGRARPGPR